MSKKEYQLTPNIKVVVRRKTFSFYWTGPRHPSCVVPCADNIAIIKEQARLEAEGLKRT